MSTQLLSVNTRAQALIDALKANAAELKVAVVRGAQGETLIDAGSAVQGSVAVHVEGVEIDSCLRNQLESGERIILGCRRAH